jgi:hypothetical protein
VAKAEPTNPFVGRWRITHMDQWDQDFVDAEVEGYVEFDPRGSGEFRFGHVHGGMDCRLTTRDGQPSVRGGWVWNLWGRECVVVRFRDGRTLRIGTDDAENLAAFLGAKTGRRGA